MTPLLPTLTTKTGVLHGTLLIPPGAKNAMPVALIIAGSGPTDREGNSPVLPGKNNSLAMLADARRIMAQLKAGRAVDSVPPQLVAVFRPSVQPYMISWLPIDPAQEVGRLTVPVLVVQGTTDIQVNKADADRLATDTRTPRSR